MTLCLCHDTRRLSLAMHKAYSYRRMRSVIVDNKHKPCLYCHVHSVQPCTGRAACIVTCAHHTIGHACIVMLVSSQHMLVSSQHMLSCIVPCLYRHNTCLYRHMLVPSHACMVTYTLCSHAKQCLKGSGARFFNCLAAYFSTAVFSTVLTIGLWQQKCCSL